MTGLHLSPRERNIFVVFVLVFAVYLGYLGLYRPACERRQRVTAEIIQARKQLREQLKVIERERALEARFKGALEPFRQQSPDEKVMSTILSEIETAAGGRKVHITQMKPLPAHKGDLYNTFSVSLTMDGDLMEFLRFIHILQSPEHNLEVTEMSLDKSAQTSGDVLARLVVSRILIPQTGESR